MALHLPPVTPPLAPEYSGEVVGWGDVEGWGAMDGWNAAEELGEVDGWNKEDRWGEVGGGGGVWASAGPEDDYSENGSPGASERLLLDVSAAIRDLEEGRSQRSPTLSVLGLSLSCENDDFHAMRTFMAEWDAFQAVFNRSHTEDEFQATVETEVRNTIPPDALFSIRRGVWLSVFASSDGGAPSPGSSGGRSTTRAETENPRSTRAAPVHTQFDLHSCKSCRAYFVSSTLPCCIPAIISKELMDRYEASRTGTSKGEDEHHDAFQQSLDSFRAIIEALVWEDRRSLNLGDSLTCRRLGKDGPIKEILELHGYEAQEGSQTFSFLLDLEKENNLRTRLLPSWLELTIITAVLSARQVNGPAAREIPTKLDWLQLRQPTFQDLESSEESPPLDPKESQPTAAIECLSQSPATTQTRINSPFTRTLTTSPSTKTAEQECACYSNKSVYGLDVCRIRRADGTDIILSSKNTIGQGGSGVVFKATHPSFGVVAIKSPRINQPTRDEIEKCIRHFQYEARIWGRLQHPNILPFLGMIRSAHKIYLVAAFSPNGTLPNYVKSHPESDKLCLIAQCAQGIEYLHSRGYVHGDVKGSNILVSGAGTALVTDFGLSKVVDTATTASRRGGSTRWLSPELLSEDGGKTFRSDVFAFGMTIVEIFTGKLPYHYLRNDAQVIQAIVMGKHPITSSFVFPGQERSSVLQSLCQRCWDADPWKRPSMGDILKELSSVPSPLHKSLMPILSHAWLVLAPPFAAIALFSRNMARPHGPAAVLAAVLFIPLPSSFFLWVFANRRSRCIAKSSWNTCRRLWSGLYYAARECWYSLNDVSQTVLVAGFIVTYVSGVLLLVLWYHTMAISEDILGA